MNNIEHKRSSYGIDYLHVKRQAKTLVILMHGYGANMQDLLSLHQFYDENIDWIFPNAPLSLASLGMPGGQAWFHIDMEELNRAIQQGIPRDFESKRPVEFIQALTQMTAFMNEVEKDYDEIIVGGFSQGAMMAMHLSFSVGFSAQKIKGLLILSGAFLDREGLVAKIQKAHTFPIFQSHGRFDQVLDFAGAAKLHTFFVEAGKDIQFYPFNGAHEIPMDVIQASGTFFNKCLS